MTVAPVDQTTRLYCTPADVSTRIDISKLPGVNLEHLIRAATEKIESYCNRVFTRVPASGDETRHFLGNGLTALPIDDLLSLTSVTVDDDAADLDDILQMPFGKTPVTWLEYQGGGTWPANENITIVGAWGYAATVPWEIWDVTASLVVRALERAKTAYQDASAIPDVGQLIYAKAIPPDLRAVLDRKRKRNV